MFFEGNEISALRKRRVKDEDLLLLSMEENIDELQRTQKLLNKSNPIQINAALSNFTVIAKQDPVLFDKEIMQQLIKEITFPKDENIMFNTAVAIDELLKENLLRQKTI